MTDTERAKERANAFPLLTYNDDGSVQVGSETYSRGDCE